MIIKLWRMYTTKMSRNLRHFSEIGPDYYEMGALLARELGGGCLENRNNCRTGGIGSKYECCAGEFSDTLEQMKGEIAWCYYQQEDCNVLDEIRARAPVDHLVVLDSRMLDRIGEQADNDELKDIRIFGIGYSVKSIAMLDYGKIDGLVAPDGYEIGYKSVEEMAKKLQHRFYKTKSAKTAIKMIRRDDLFQDEDIERFLYSYE